MNCLMILSKLVNLFLFTTESFKALKREATNNSWSILPLKNANLILRINWALEMILSIFETACG